MDKYVEELGNLSPSRVKKLKGDLKDLAKDELGEHQQICDQIQCQEDQHGQDQEMFKYVFAIIRYSLTGVLLPLFDIGSDLFTAGTHYYWGDWAWGSLTLAFVGLPGLVCGLSLTIFGLRKQFTLRRLINYGLVAALMPVAYPLLQILVSSYMVFLMIIRRDRIPVEWMGQDVKQFKSLEGFLESGPQFVLQTYILLRGARRGAEDLEEADVKRILTISLSIFLSMASLVKTAVNVNRPDPDERRKEVQDASRAPRFILTSLMFNACTVIFRVSSFGFFYATIRYWANAVILAIIGINVSILYFVADANYVVVLLLGIVSTFAPNGYLLYNFAGTFQVDLTLAQVRRFLFLHLPLVTLAVVIPLLVIGGFFTFADINEVTHIKGTVLSSPKVFYGFEGCILAFGLLSILAFVNHWTKSILPLYVQSHDL